MATNTEQDISQLKDDMTKLKADLASIASTLKQEAGERARHGYDRVREAGNHAADYARSGAHAVEHQIEERPLVSVLSAFGIGFVIGKLLDRH